MNFRDSPPSKRSFNLCNAFLSKQCPKALAGNIWLALLLGEATAAVFLKITQDIYLEQLKEALHSTQIRF